MSDHERDLHPNLADALDQLEDEPLSADEVAELDLLAHQLGDLGEDLDAGAPPADLWSRIEAEALGAPVEGDRVDEAHPAVAASHGAVVALAPRRRRLALAALAAAAAVVVVIGFVTMGDDEPEPTIEEVVLEPLPGFDDAAGTATLVVDGDQRTVRVDLEGTEVPADHHLELWLLDEEVTEIIPLGVIEGGEHTIPAEVDLGSTPVVDISLEPDDGDPAHSGVSIVRGVVAT